MLKPKLFSIIKHRTEELTPKQLKQDIVSGIVVAIVALPLSIALAIATGVTPEKGLITSIIAGFFISFLGGSRVQIGGPTAAFVVILSGILAKYGSQGLTIATIMAGGFMILFGFMKFGSVIKYIPYPITTGFTSGIAVVLFSSELKDFLGLNFKVPSQFFSEWKVYLTSFSKMNLTAILVGLIAIIIILLWPKANKTVPGSLIALIASTFAVKIFNLQVPTIGSKFGKISNSISIISFSDFHINLAAIQALIGPAITIAFLASVESLLSAVVADGMLSKKHNSNMELIAQGVANIASALFGGIAATGAIARTATNVKNGGRTPIAGIVHALVVLIIMIIFMPFAKLIPMTTLAAILLVVSYNMSQWRSFKALLKSPKSDITILLVTFILTVIFDLVTAIEIGMVIAMFLFVKRMSDSTVIKDNNQAYNNRPIGSNILLYEINGPLFFGAATSFVDTMKEIDKDVNIVVFKMKNVPHMDATAFNVLKDTAKKYREQHILVLYSCVNEQPMKLMQKTGFLDKTGLHCFFKHTEDAIEAANEIIAAKVAL